jgi:hypothetical protein
MSDRFDERGMLVIPDPRCYEKKAAEKVLVLNHCYCPEGHDLISSRACFNGRSGIMIRVRKLTGEGTVALSPIYGDKTRVALDIDLESGEILDLRCPICDAPLPVYTQCPSCDGQMVAIFTQPKADFANCVAVCNRVDCPIASIIDSGQLIAQSMIETA